MTGLEPHPIFTLPTREQALALEKALGREAAARRLNAVIEDRRRRMEAELEDPFVNGYESPIWHLLDDLLCDGKRVCLIDHPQVLPRDFTKSQSAQIELVGRRELFISGANGASKSEFAAKKLMKILRSIGKALTWAFHETEKESIDRQQPLFVRYLPTAIRQAVMATGRYKQGAITNVSWTQKNGFTEKSFVLPNGSQQTFKFYKQEEQTVEGAQLHAIWADELVPLNLVETLRFRLMKHRGIFLVTFTPIKGWTATYQEYVQGSKILLEVPAPRLPIKDKAGQLTGEFEKVPRLAIGGPGTKGNLSANVVWMQSEDNPFLDKKELDERLAGAHRNLVLERGYGVATRAFANQFPKFNELIHVVPPDRISKEGTNYLILDPVAGRNWFMLWLRVHPDSIVRPDGRTSSRVTVYREWPSTGHKGLSAYIPGVGDPGPWTLPGNAADGQRGPAQDSFGWGLDRYKNEILRLEGCVKPEASHSPGLANGGGGGVDMGGPKVRRITPQNPLLKRRVEQNGAVTGEIITERLMDSRYGAKPTQMNERTTTLLEQMSDIGMEFLPASGKDIDEGVHMINGALDYDDRVELGAFSPDLARINSPLLMISEECPNLIYSLREWTGKDGQHGACKDPVDCLRYGFEHDLQYIGENAFAWGRY